jgi:hypothetical protein
MPETAISRIPPADIDHPVLSRKVSPFDGFENLFSMHAQLTQIAGRVSIDAKANFVSSNFNHRDNDQFSVGRF